MTLETDDPRVNAPTLDTIELCREVPRGPWVLEFGGPEGTQALALSTGDDLVVGSGRDTDLRIADRAVSSRHCRIRADAAGVRLEDLGSRNGLFVGAARVRTAELAQPDSSFVIGRTTVALRARSEDASEHVPPAPGLVGSSAAMQRVAAEVRRHARTRAPVLLQGESGTGKDVVARALHTLSGRSGAYVPINGGGLPDSLADAELFGHLRGAFTGAATTRAGAFEQAHRGTLFLDEVADLSPALQVKLLRAVEEGSVRPLGATKALSVDVRMVSASWASLPQRVAEGRFRLDLYHRLATVVIELPPLRKRKSDLAMLSRFLLGRLRDEVGARELDGAALAILSSYSWPGNVRELAAVLYRAAVHSQGPIIRASDVRLPNLERPEPRGERPPSEDVLRLLEHHHGNVSAASRAARVPRSTFRSWLDKAREGADQNLPTAAIPTNPGATAGETRSPTAPPLPSVELAEPRSTK